MYHLCLRVRTVQHILMYLPIHHVRDQCAHPHCGFFQGTVCRHAALLTYAGRLDKESEGLLLLSNDGDLIQAMMKGSHGHEKEYQVRVDREITDDFLKKMGAGVYLKELEVTTRPCKIEKTGKYTFQIILTQGLNRQIRRMCRTFGYEVRELKRIRVMNITLKGLKPGTYRELTEEERNRLYADCGLKEK